MSLHQLVDLFTARRVLVVGDVILDHYIRGSVTRTSPEAPVPILNVESEEWLPGGAANVARNLVTLGAKVTLIGLVGEDDAAKKLTAQLKSLGGLTPAMIADGSRPTILKSRAVAQGQQMIRLDRELTHPASAKVIESALAQVQKHLPKVDGVIVSDYGKGFLTPEFLQQLIVVAKAAEKPVLVDPKGRDYRRYRGATLITPNAKEAAEATGVALVNDAAVAEAAKQLQATIGGDAIVITRGAQGVSVFPKRGAGVHLPAKARQVFDVTGAGDTFISVLALAHFGGAKLAEAASLGNLAGGIVVGLAGVATVSPEQLRAACAEAESGTVQRKLVSRDELQQVCRTLRQAGRKIVFTNGFFDLFHHGHLRLLEQARAQGDCLIVAINSDAGTRRLKGAPRPILTAQERVALLSALAPVDYVVLFDEDTPVSLLELVRPDVIVKGGLPTDRAESVVGGDVVLRHGGRVHLVEVGGGPTIESLVERAKSQPASSRKSKS